MMEFRSGGALGGAARRHARRATRLHLAAVGAAAVLVALVAGCATNGTQRALGLPSGDRLERAEATAQFRTIPAARAYVNSPAALLVLERDLGSAVEQRITLPNETSLAGENKILLRAQTSGSASPNRLIKTELMTRFGGAPAPFSATSGQQFMTVEDRYGAYVYTTRQMGNGVTCVLALRRVQTGARPLPQGSTALDIMLRNCVQGSAEQALAPIGAAAFGLGAAPSGGG